MTKIADIPVVILAGGRGARFDHETVTKPKPLIEVMGRPIIDHIMYSFVDQGSREFIVCGGYLIEELKRHFYEMSARKGHYFRHCVPPYAWSYGIEFIDCGVKVTVVDTGVNSGTADRLALIEEIIKGRSFFLTYGDGLGDVTISDVIKTHNYGSQIYSSAPYATLTAVKAPGRFGVISRGNVYDEHVICFREKCDEEINGGFIFVEPKIFDFMRQNGGHSLAALKDSVNDPKDITLTQISFEEIMLPRLAAELRLKVHRHTGYWRCIDSRKDIETIERDCSIHDDSSRAFPWSVRP